MAKITWLGHSAFLIEEEDLRILIDPFLDGCPTASMASADLPPIDVVLVTHDHADHVGQAVEICKSHGAVLGAVVETACRLADEGIPADQVLNGIGFNFGGTVSHKEAYFTLVPAQHTSGTGLPAGFIIKMPSGKTIYHAGDTGLFSDMELWARLYPMDVALLPIGGVFTMDARQAARACSMLHIDKVIPMHFGTFPALDATAEKFEKEITRHAPNCTCLTLAPGQSAEI